MGVRWRGRLLARTSSGLFCFFAAVLRSVRATSKPTSHALRFGRATPEILGAALLRRFFRRVRAMPSARFCLMLTEATSELLQSLTNCTVQKYFCGVNSYVIGAWTDTPLDSLVKKRDSFDPLFGTNGILFPENLLTDLQEVLLRYDLRAANDRAKVRSLRPVFVDSLFL